MEIKIPKLEVTIPKLNLVEEYGNMEVEEDVEE